jgi:hypothetical protein
MAANKDVVLEALGHARDPVEALDMAKRFPGGINAKRFILRAAFHQERTRGDQTGNVR